MENAPGEIRKETKEEQAKRDETTDQQCHYLTEKEEILLVKIRPSMREEFSSFKCHSTLWHKLTKIQLDNNVIVTCKQAQEVFYVASAIFQPYKGGRHNVSGNLKKKYKEREFNNNKSGRERLTCKFYEFFSNLYGPGHRVLFDTDHTDDGDLHPKDEKETPKKPPPKRIKSKESKSKRL